MIPLPTQLTGARFLAERQRAFLTQDYLKECLDYDPVAGVFRWKLRPVEHFQDGVKVPAKAKRNRWNARYAGTTAGSTNADLHVRINLDGEKLIAHRLAWFWVYGVWPDGQLDHRDVCPSNNAFRNLRPATHSQNVANRPAQKNNTSGYKGVTFHKKARRWTARVEAKGRRFYLGLFNTPEEAHEAYVKAANSVFGEFARAS